MAIEKTNGAVQSQGKQWVSPCCDNRYPIQPKTPFSSTVMCRCGKSYELQNWTSEVD